MRDNTKHATEVEQASRKLVQATSETDVGTHLSEKKKSSQMHSRTTRRITQDVERVKIGSHKICIREDLAKEKMVFSEESSRAIFEMGNLELIELNKSSIQCPSCFRFEGTLLCKCGMPTKPDQVAMNRIK